MDTSTPLVTHSDLRRRTLLKNAANVSPLRRSLNASFSQTPLLEITNDETERSNRRNNAEMQKRLSNISQNVVNLNESFVKRQFLVCTHLYTENKITTKNAWKLQIIDLLKPLCQKSDKDKLQVASTSIDISAKVYSIRVDDVHADSLKLASNMARVSNKENVGIPADGDDEVDENDLDKGNKQAKKKKKKRVNPNGDKNTVCSTKNNLGTLPRLEPSDFATRVNAETGQIDNLFTNVLKEDNSNYKFVLLDKGVTLLEDHDPVVENLNQNDPIKLSNLPPLPNVILKLSPHFQDFKVDEWDPDQEDQQLNVEKVVFDDQGIPIPELDGSIHDIFENNDDNMDVDVNNDDDIQLIHEEVAPQLRGEVAHIVDFRSISDSAHQTSEYSFNSIVNTNTGKFIDQIWAGPCHWKLKFIRRSSTRFSGQKIVVKENRQKRKKTQPEMLDFKEIDIDYSQVLRIKKRPPSVDVNKITLPIQDRSYIKLMETIRELMLKPGVCPVEKKLIEDQLDYQVDPYKYENPNDSLYCSQNTGDDGAGDADMDNFSAEEDQVVPARQNFAGENLVDVPEMVSTWNVPYALKAKQMDMRKLKAAIWLKLTESTHNLLGRDLQDRSGTVVFQTFSEMYKHLPNLLSDKERKELTCPLAFVALLHLCNEQNLALAQLPGYKDFNIKGPN